MFFKKKKKEKPISDQDYDRYYKMLMEDCLKWLQTEERLSRNEEDKIKLIKTINIRKLLTDEKIRKDFIRTVLVSITKASATYTRLINFRYYINVKYSQRFLDELMKRLIEYLKLDVLNEITEKEFIKLFKENEWVIIITLIQFANSYYNEHNNNNNRKYNQPKQRR